MHFQRPPAVVSRLLRLSTETVVCLTEISPKISSLIHRDQTFISAPTDNNILILFVPTYQMLQTPFANEKGRAIAVENISFNTTHTHTPSLRTA